MFRRMISWLIFTFVVVSIATGYSGEDFENVSVPVREVRIQHLRTEDQEPTTAEPVHEVSPNTAVDLKADCEHQVVKQLSVETAADTAVLAVRYSCDSLRKASIDYIRTHIFQVMATHGWADAINTQPQVMIKVMELLSQSPGENSTPASAINRTTTITDPHSDQSSHGQTPSSNTSPTTFYSSISSGTNDTSPLCSSDPPESGSSPNHATQPNSEYKSYQTPTTAVPTTVAQTITSTDDVHICFLRSLPPEEKTRRLMEAAKQGAVGELEALLAAGADVAARDRHMVNWTALHWAAALGHEEAARRLLAAGAAVDARESGQRTPLHRAAWEGHAAVVRLLLENGADHGARDGSGGTPLHSAAFWGYREVAAALLEAGADRAARNDWGDTPLDRARQQRHQQVVELLEGSSPTAGT